METREWLLETSNHDSTFTMSDDDLRMKSEALPPKQEWLSKKKRTGC
jgi:hypothetical protein